jgi:TetR/AcrR family transcriptional regulator
VSFTREFEHSQELFDAAVTEFVARGYEVASINTILETAGMSKGQFYYHFKNKEGLYFALIEVMIAKKRAFMAQVMESADFQQDLFTLFQTQIRYGLAFARDYPAINRFSESFLREKGNAIYTKAIARFNLENDAAINGLVARAYHNGELRTDLPLAFMQKIIGYLFSHVVELVDLSRMADAEENLNYLLAFMKCGLARSREE